MPKESTLATQRLELASKGYDLKPLSEVDPALRIPRSRFDGWANLTTGFGRPSQHPVSNSQYEALDKINAHQQEQMYRSDWVTRKGIDAPAEDMTRNGISYQHNDDDEEQEDEEKKKDNQEKSQKLVEDFDDLLNEDFKLWQTAFQAIALARASGGSHTLFNFNDIQTAEEFKEPLNENQVSEIRWVRTIPAWYSIPLTYYRDINHPKWGQPEHYQVIIREAGFGITLQVHESRMIRMDGRFTTQAAKIQNRGWNDSEIQAVYTALRDYGICVMSTSSTLETFTQDYLGMKGLAEKVMMGETDYVLERIALTHAGMTSNKLNIFDADSETMERKGTPITGLAKLWDGYTDAICGAWGIPKSRFFSSESGKLGGSSSESDTRNYFNGTHSKQEIQLRPWLNSFMLFVNLANKMLTGLPSYTFNELQEQSDKEKADTRYTQAQTDQIYMQEQVLSPEEVTISRFSKEETDLETNTVDFAAREEMEDEATPEEVDEMRETIANMEMENAVNEAATQQNIENQQPQKPAQKPIEEKQDQVINVKPEINIEAPIVNVKIPELKDHTENIKNKLNEIKGKLDENVKKELTEIKDKLDEDIDI
ncbi:MAG TPA: DUF1073 domain-containing protein [bacterium]|nr:DUF1073 domain-containing protein [bacterium]